MAQPAQIIIDTMAKGAQYFWKMHASAFFKELPGSRVFYGTLDHSLASGLTQSLQDGRKKFIILGNHHTIFHSINCFMQVAPALRNTLAIGFLPISPLSLCTSLMSPLHLLPTLKILKFGQTYPVNLVKMEYTTNAPQRVYFWKNCRVTNLDTYVNTTLIIDENHFPIHDPLHYTLSLHFGSLHCSQMDPADLKNAHKIHVNFSLGTLERMKNFSRNGTNSLTQLDKPKQGSFVKILTPNPTLEVRIPNQIEHTSEIRCEVHAKALPVIVPLIPIRSEDLVSAPLLGLQPKKVVTTHAVTHREKTSAHS